MNPHIEHRVRERAYRIWLDEGMPEGRADLHWSMASELVATEEHEEPSTADEAAPAEAAARRPATAKAAESGKPVAKRAAAAAKTAVTAPEPAPKKTTTAKRTKPAP